MHPDAKVRINFSIFEGFMENSYKYTVAGHTFQVILPEGFSKEEYLAPYEPFACGEDREPLFTLNVELTDRLRDTVQGRVRECLNEEPPFFWIFDDQGRFSFGFSYGKSHPDCVLVPSEDYRNNVVYVPSSHAKLLTEFAVSNAMMLLYTFCTTPLDTLMVHASVIKYQDGGYMFLGKSGTGKSTHSSLWLKNIEGSELLNDDNPVIRIVDGVPYIYGTPWSGKTPCYKNEVVPLKGFVRLSQAPFNKITRSIPLQAYASLLPSCSCMKWDRKANEALHKTVEKVIMQVGGWHLECLPDAAAAFTCHSAVTDVK